MNERMDVDSTASRRVDAEEIEYEVEAIVDWKLVSEGNNQIRLYKVHFGFNSNS